MAQMMVRRFVEITLAFGIQQIHAKFRWYHPDMVLVPAESDKCVQDYIWSKGSMTLSYIHRRFDGKESRFCCARGQNLSSIADESPLRQHFPSFTTA